jgi:hypothetical protein
MFAMVIRENSRAHFLPRVLVGMRILIEHPVTMFRWRQWGM